MKIAIMAGHNLSGGLYAYLRGILSVETEHQIRVYCVDSSIFKDAAATIKFTETEFSHERGKEILFDKKLPEELIKLVDDFTPDIVLFGCGWVRRGLEKYPNIMILHNQLYIDNYAFLHTLQMENFYALLGFRIIVRRSMKRADGVIFLSEISKQNADKACIKYKMGKVVHFGLSDDFYISDNKPKGVIQLLYISSFYKYKNHETVIKALKLLWDAGYNVRLLLVGKGPEKREKIVYRLVDELGLRNNVDFLGWKPHDEAMRIMNDADIFVYPSEVESTGLGIMEAMAAKKAIACSDASCMKEILRDAGVYFSPRNHDDAARAIERLICDEELRTRLAEKAYAYSKEFTWKNAVEEHISFFCGFLN